MIIKGNKEGYKGSEDHPISVTAEDETIGILDHLLILRLIATNELFVNRKKITRNIDNDNCFFFRSAVLDLFKGWRTWIKSDSTDPSEIWNYPLAVIANDYQFSRRAIKRAAKMDSEINRLFQADRVGIIDTLRLPERRAEQSTRGDSQ